jgi:hypothetical protein
MRLEINADTLGGMPDSSADAIQKVANVEDEEKQTESSEEIARRVGSFG